MTSVSKLGTVGGFNPQHLSEARGGFDGKRVRKAIQRRTVDYNSTLMRYLESRAVNKTIRDYIAIQPEPSFVVNYLPPNCYIDNPISSVATKFIHTSTNKVRCPINAIRWTPEGRRLITGSSTGEFTLWNGLTFNFETILQAHFSAIRCMKWSHNDTWMISGDDSGAIKYWQSNMNNLKELPAHKETVRDLSFSPTDSKFASCSDDGTIKIWSFAEAQEERVLTGHGWDVKCLAWHPTKGLLASGSKDNLAKIWDPKTGKALATLHGHKNTIMQTSWNKNGNWLLTACRDQLVRLYDIRTMKELQVFRGHKREVQSISWHPIHEKLFVSGGWEGSMIYWQVGDANPLAEIETAHESSVFALDWHPMGHILASGSNDHTTRFWTRNRPGDPMNDRMNLSKEEADAMGLKAEEIVDDMGGGHEGGHHQKHDSDKGVIPGLDSEYKNFENKQMPTNNRHKFNNNSRQQSNNRGGYNNDNGHSGSPRRDFRNNNRNEGSNQRYGGQQSNNYGNNNRNDQSNSGYQNQRDYSKSNRGRY